MEKTRLQEAGENNSPGKSGPANTQTKNSKKVEETARH